LNEVCPNILLIYEARTVGARIVQPMIVLIFKHGYCVFVLGLLWLTIFGIFFQLHFYLFSIFSLVLNTLDLCLM